MKTIYVVAALAAVVLGSPFIPRTIEHFLECMERHSDEVTPEFARVFYPNMVKFADRNHDGQFTVEDLDMIYEPLRAYFLLFAPEYMHEGEFVTLDGWMAMDFNNNSIVCEKEIFQVISNPDHELFRPVMVYIFMRFDNISIDGVLEREELMQLRNADDLAKYFDGFTMEQHDVNVGQVEVVETVEVVVEEEEGSSGEGAVDEVVGNQPSEVVVLIDETHPVEARAMVSRNVMEEDVEEAAEVQAVFPSTTMEPMTTTTMEPMTTSTMMNMTTTPESAVPSPAPQPALIQANSPPAMHQIDVPVVPVEHIEAVHQEESTVRSSSTTMKMMLDSSSTTETVMNSTEPAV